jgi:molybdopterin converting factor subunit 1
MTLSVQLFARGRELVGADAALIEVPGGTTVAVLRRVLGDRYPALAPLLERSAVAVNHDFAEESCVIVPTDEVAVIPPVSGG